MPRKFFFFFWLLFSTQINACEVMDDTGVVLRIDKPARRIISLAPDVTETLFAIGAGDHVIGVIDSSDYPEAARNIQSIGSYSGIDLERIIALHPDLIVTWGRTFSRQLQVLKKLGIPIYSTQPQRLEDIPRTMKNLGCLAGTESTAEALALHFTQRLQQLRQQYSQQKKLRVFYQIGAYSLFTINKDSWIHEVLTLCGGLNIFANAKSISPEVSLESVVVANPEVILTDATNVHWQTRWQKWKNITAVKTKNLFAINPDTIDRAGPRLLDGALQICKAFQQARMVVR